MFGRRGFGLKVRLVATQPIVAGNAFTMHMAVPTLYSRYMDAFGSLSSTEQQCARSMLKTSMRVCISGSSALTAEHFNAWRRLGSDDESQLIPPLLERYGMSETGMRMLIL
jgi:acyl-CoA synthetase (AMP-forming)/AMP-acid ligase II